MKLGFNYGLESCKILHFEWAAPKVECNQSGIYCRPNFIGNNRFNHTQRPMTCYNPSKKHMFGWKILINKIDTEHCSNKLGKKEKKERRSDSM